MYGVRVRRTWYLRRSLLRTRKYLGLRPFRICRNRYSVPTYLNINNLSQTHRSHRLDFKVLQYNILRASRRAPSQDILPSRYGLRPRCCFRAPSLLYHLALFSSSDFRDLGLSPSVLPSLHFPLISLPFTSTTSLLANSIRYIISEPLSCDAAAHAASLLPLASNQSPPSYTRINLNLPNHPVRPSKPAFKAVHPRVAVLLGISRRWHIPLLTCRGLSTLPAAWWGLRCAVVFLGELLRGSGAELAAGEWDVEKRFRVTEVFLAILWVGLQHAWPKSCHERRN